MRAGARLAVTTIAIIVAGGIGGIGLAGCGKSGTSGQAGHGTMEDGRPIVLAKIGSTTITSATLDERVKELPQFAQAEFKGEEGRKRLLERLVEEEMMYQAALDAGLANDAEISKKLRDTRRRTLVEGYYTRFVQEAAKPGEAEIEQYYREHSSEFTEPAQARVRHVLVKTEGEARKIRGRIASGEIDFETAARTLSTDERTRDDAGLIPGYVAADRPVGPLGKLPELVDAAMALEPGQVSEPVKTSVGWHLLKLEEKRPERVRPLEEVREQIEARGSGERVREKFVAQMDSLRTKYRVRIMEVTAEAVPPASAEELFQQAQETSDPRARIALFEQVLSNFPQDKRAYEAQFMIGFVYSEDLKEFAPAKEAFEKVLANYPESELAESARWMISNMHLENPPFTQEGGKTAEEAKPVEKKAG